LHLSAKAEVKLRACQEAVPAYNYQYHHQKGSEPDQAAKSATSVPRCISTAARLAAPNPALRSTGNNSERDPADPDPRPAGNDWERGPAAERGAPWATDRSTKAPGDFAWSERTDAGNWDSQATHAPRRAAHNCPARAKFGQNTGQSSCTANARSFKNTGHKSCCTHARGFKDTDYSQNRKTWKTAEAGKEPAVGTLWTCLSPGPLHAGSSSGPVRTPIVLSVISSPSVEGPRWFLSMLMPMDCVGGWARV
jgi:hypothetical protein